MMRTMAASISCFRSSSTFCRVSFLSGSDSPCLAATAEIKKKAAVLGGGNNSLRATPGKRHRGGSRDRRPAPQPAAPRVLNKRVYGCILGSWAGPEVKSVAASAREHYEPREWRSDYLNDPVKFALVATFRGQAVRRDSRSSTTRTRRTNNKAARIQNTDWMSHTSLDLHAVQFGSELIIDCKHVAVLYFLGLGLLGENSLSGLPTGQRLQGSH